MVKFVNGHWSKLHASQFPSCFISNNLKRYVNRVTNCNWFFLYRFEELINDGLLKYKNMLNEMMEQEQNEGPWPELVSFSSGQRFSFHTKELFYFYLYLCVISVRFWVSELRHYLVKVGDVIITKTTNRCRHWYATFVTSLRCFHIW